jgi:hypothetical protein
MPAIKYNVDMVSQQSSPVCWLACATMLLQFKRQMTPTAMALGMTDGTDFRGPRLVPSYGAAEWEHMRRLGMINARSSELNLGVRAMGQEAIYQQLRRHGPFILHHYCGSFWYGPMVPTVPTTGAHSVLVVGTDTVRGCVWFNNPWGDRDIMTTTASIVGAIVRWERNPASKSITYM